MAKSVLMCFGGRSAEHEISVITALQALEALDPERWTSIPLYVAPDGRCWGGDALRNRTNYRAINADPSAVDELHEVKLRLSGGALEVVQETKQSNRFFRQEPKRTIPDVVFPLFHGTFGEDGAFQGLVEWSGLPCVGSGSRASAVGMDKAMTKVVAKANGVEVLPWQIVRVDTFDPGGIAECERGLLDRMQKYPLIVKPNVLGSSIGIKPVKSQRELLAAFLDIKALDDSVIVEPMLQDFREINIAVMSYPALRVSAIEEPKVAKDDTFLTFEQKYTRGGAKGKLSAGQGMTSLPREIEPKWVTPEQHNRIEESAKAVFTALGCRGVARVDFLIDKTGRVIFNEINTIPGSLAHYLWIDLKAPLTFTGLLDNMIEEAIDGAAKRQCLTRFDGKLRVL
jgi:D-alanine-D-alanine ligase